MADEIAELVVRISADTSELASAVSGVQSQLSALDATRIGRNMGNAAQLAARNWQMTGQALRGVGASIDSVTKPIQVAAVALAAGGAASAKFAIDFEDSFAGVKKTVEGTPEQLAQIRQGIIDLTTTGINGRNAIPKTTTELNELAAAGGQLGVQTENILGFTETMAQLDTATNLHGESGAQAVARFLNVTDTSQKSIDRFGSAVVDLGNNFATTEAEIVDMGLDMGATGHTIGMSTQAILGYSTALSSMGVDAAAGGSALQRIWMDMQNAVSSGGEELNAFAKISGKSADEFKKSWGKDADGAFRDFLKGLNESDDQVGVLNELGFNNVRDQRALMALAGDKGFAILTEAINRANKAWDENTALQKEFDAKADTTASKIQIVKNNLVETGRSLGEVMLPTIADATSGIANFAQWLAKMGDGGKKTAVGIAATVVGVGALSKVTAGGLKTVGNFVEGIGKVRTAFSAGGVFAKAVPALTALGSAALPVAVGIAAVGTAAIAAKKAYDNWYDSQYRYTKGLSEGNEQIKESLDGYKKISAIQGEIKELKLVIENPESSKEQVDNAKERLEEIKQLLSEEYNLVIKSDNSNLEEAVNTVREINENELQGRINSQLSRLSTLQEKYTQYQQERNQLENDYADALERQKKYSDIELQRSKAKSDWKSGLTSYAEYKKRLADILRDNGINKPNIDGDPFTAWTGVSLDTNKANDDVKKLSQRINDLKTARDEYEAISTEIANWETEIIDSAVKSGDSEQVQQALSDMGEVIRDANLDMQGYAQAAAQAMNGISIDDAWAQGGEGLVNFVNDYVRAMQEFGASAQETATGAALIRNGFRTIDEAVEKDALPSVVNDYISQAQKMNVPAEQIAMQASLIKQGFTDISQAADAGAMDVVNEQANELAHSLLDIPDDKRIEISAEGDISVIDTASGKIQELQKSDGTVIRVTSEGDVEMLDKAGNTVAYLEGIGAVELKVNTETGNLEALDSVGNVVANLSEQGDPNVNINVTATTDAAKATITDLNNQPVEVKVGADAEGAKQTIQALGDIPITVTVTAEVVGMPQATGTDNFPGGLAMVNDQTGIADPRELIIDRGQAFIPQGRNVILPLSKGAKVYTASQTKAIMAGMGIPHYAEGKDNSDAFTAARDNRSHYTRTHAVTTTQELEKWVEFSKQFASNEKDIADITEQIYSLTRKQTDELNDQSSAYMELHNALNDWADIGDTPIDAFNRIRERNMAEVEAGRMTWNEYTDTISKMGSDMLNDRLSQSRDWLEREKDYHGMSLEDYIAGLDRMEAYTREYYDNGVISYREYAETIAEITDDKIDSYRDLLSAEMDASLAWIDDRTHFNDWQSYGDTPDAAYDRIKDREYAAMEDGQQSWDDYVEHMAEAGSALYQGRREQSESWLEEQRKYFGMSSEDYIAGLEREKAYTEEYYRKGLISAREYHEGMTDLNHQIWDEAASAYDDMLSQQSKYISDMREKFADEEQALRDSWDVADRDEDMDDVRRQLEIYAGAVTDRGQQKYKDLQEQLKQLERDEELYQLQVDNNAVLERLEADYDLAEDAKADFLKSIAVNTDIDVSGIVGGLTERLTTTGGNIENLLARLIEAVNNSSAPSSTVYGPTYNDNRQISLTQTSGLTPLYVGEMR